MASAAITGKGKAGSSGLQAGVAMGPAISQRVAQIARNAWRTRDRSDVPTRDNPLVGATRGSRKRRLIACIAAWLLSPAVAAGPQDAPGTPEVASTAVAGARVYRPRDPYAGVVTDATLTRIGHDFYYAFAAHWRTQENVEQFSLTVHERPSARWGSLVWVDYSGRQIFRTFLSPGRRDHVPVAAEEASRSAYQSVVDSEVQRQLFRDPDLAQDEL